LHRESLVDKRVTDRFNVFRTTINGRGLWRAGGFVILPVVEGKCTIATKNEQISPSKFDRLLIPHGLEELEIVANKTAVFWNADPLQCDGNQPPHIFL